MVNDHESIYLGRFTSGARYGLGEYRGEKVGAGARVLGHFEQNKGMGAH